MGYQKRKYIYFAYKDGLMVHKKEFESKNNIYKKEKVDLFVKLIKSGLSVKEACKKAKIGIDTGYLIIHGKRYKEVLEENSMKPLETQYRADFDKYKDEIIYLIKSGNSNKEIRDLIPIKNAKESNYNYYIRKLKKLLNDNVQRLSERSRLK